MSYIPIGRIVLRIVSHLLQTILTKAAVFSEMFTLRTNDAAVARV
jgi:hypothetical protein